jgi:hypothetical protein
VALFFALNRTPKPERAPTENMPGPVKVEPSKVVLQIKPPDAEVRVDGKLAQPPYALEGLPGRSFHVEVRRAGFKSDERDVVVAAEDRRLPVQLEPAGTTPSTAPAAVVAAETPKPSAEQPAFGTLQVNVEPWAYVSVDGGKQVETPATLRLAAGNHKLVISNPGLKKHKEIPISVKAHQKKAMSFDLTRD